MPKGHAADTTVKLTPKLVVGDTLRVDRVYGLRLPPTPLDECEFERNKVYCYFKDFGETIRQHVGFIENNRNCAGRLLILSQGDGHAFRARVVTVM